MTIGLRGVASYLRVPSLGIGAAAVLAALAMFTWFAVYHYGPARAERGAHKAELVSLQNARALVTRRVEAAARFDETAAAIAALDARLFARTDRSGVVARLTEISAAVGTQIIHGASSFGKDRVDVVPVLQELTVEGGYASTRAFLARLSELETLTLPLGLEMSADYDGGRVRMILRLMTLNRPARPS